MNIHSKRIMFFLMFAASGFTGLIYESIWTQYIKLFLGHAAFAQALVLSIFMLGLSLGSWFAAKWSFRFTNPFIIYAIIELIIGFFGIIFHGIYTQTTEFVYNNIFPNIVNDYSIHLIQWILAALLILPQSILLGMTFPLMSAGFIRGNQTTAGKQISILYFSNSFGAGLGVLISGYILIKNFGLPGTVLFAGFMNCILALVVYLIARKIHLPTVNYNEKLFPKVNNLFGYMLFIAFFTGLASFLYEISWIRMLTQVLGASTHAFELMLSAFIFGLAIGSFWIKTKISKIKNPKTYLGIIQLCMASAALFTIVFYNQLFDLMEYGLSVITRTEQGYTLFNILSQLIALIVMLPATIFAGMTLPLLTHILIKDGYGEKSVGLVYAANTIGAISGIIIAVSFGFLLLGSKGIIILGSTIDMILGVFILYNYSTKNFNSKKLLFSTLTFTIIFISVASIVKFDSIKLTSSVYRTGKAELSENTSIKFYKEGRTASVSVTDLGTIRVIRTNGKPDAAINMNQNGVKTIDEPTMILAAILGMLYNPNAELVANIGMGSGLTSEFILTSRTIKKLHTIEIEPLMVDAAKLFAPIVTKPFTDPRNEFVITDAKSHFASSKNKYDLIISEPSNSWVSGISGLFTKEFYEIASNNLKSNGILVQWLNIYESNEHIVASVIKAISSVMSDYAIYTSNGVDIIIVSKKSNSLGKLSEDIFSQNEISKILNKIGISSTENIRMLKIGEKAYLEPYFNSIQVSTNSDYFPYVDQNAVKARFLYTTATHLTENILTSLPYVEILDANYKQNKNKLKNINLNLFWLSDRLYDTKKLFQILKYSTSQNKVEYNHNKLELDALIANQAIMRQCENVNKYWFKSFKNVTKKIIPYINQNELEQYWIFFKKNNCYSILTENQKKWTSFLIAQTKRDTKNIFLLSNQLLKTSEQYKGYLLASYMLAGISEKKYIKVINSWDNYKKYIGTNSEYYSLIKIFYMLAADNISKNQVKKLNL